MADTDETTAQDDERDVAKVTISRKQAIDHEDPDAAGFDRGYWWKVEDHLGVFESGCATKEEAEDHALTVVRGHGYLDDAIEGLPAEAFARAEPEEFDPAAAAAEAPDPEPAEDE